MINQFAVGNMMPKLTVVLDVPAEVGLKRIKRRANDLPDRMEEENIGFYRLVREGYLLLAQSMPERFLVIDGTQSVDAVHNLILDAVRERYSF